MKPRTFIVIASVVSCVIICIGIFFALKDKDHDFDIPNVLSDHELELQVPLSQTVAARAQFAKDVSNYIATNKNFNLRPIYEKYIDQIGANGMIDVIQKLDPECHFEGHDLGKVIFSKIGTIGEALAVCQDSCYSGCMHGVFMEAFKTKQQEAIAKGEIPAKDDDGDGDGGEPHIGLSVVKESIPSICSDPTVASMYGPGDCAHGVGHAVMYLSDYDVKPAIATCNLFTDKKLAYYCASGAYMEYVAVKGQDDAKDKTKSSMYPCDSNEYPAACFFSKIGDMLYFNQQQGKQVGTIISECASLPEFYEWGCFHGFGNGFLTPVYSGKVKITDVCAYGSDTDKQMCIEGVMMRMGKYNYDTGVSICKADLKDKWQEICLDAVNQKMYGLDRPFNLYIN